MKVFIAGHTGMVGSALLRRLKDSNRIDPLTSERRVDYTRELAAEYVLQDYCPDAVVVCAAKVGGIHANNTQRADFITRNLAIQLNWVRAAHNCKLPKLILLGSSCVYPRDTGQPMKESQMLSGDFEETNRAYATAKLAGSEMCKAYYHQHQSNFYTIVPPNLFGPFDNFKEDESHVVAALIRRVYEAKSGDNLNLWGTGEARRELMHVDDAASAIEFCLRDVNAQDLHPHGIVNAGSGQEVTIRKLAETLVKISGKDLFLNFNGWLDGMPRKIMDRSRISQLGWTGPSFEVEDALASAYRWYAENQDNPFLRR